MSRRTGIAVGIVGLLLLVAAGLWSAVGAQQLVKFPTSTDVTLHYRGHLVTYLDQKTGAPLAQPRAVQLDIARTIRALPAESTSQTAVVSEHLVTRAGSTTVIENNRYAFDRHSMKEVRSRHAYTFSPRYRGASVGSYYVTLPMNLTPQTTGIHIWKPETGTTYALSPLAGSAVPSRLFGMKVIWFRGTLPMTPVAGYERASLARRGLPLTIPVSQVEAELAAAGVSVPKLSQTLLPVLSPAELKTVSRILGTPVRLRYYSFGHGLLAGEPRTGAIIALRDVVDGIAVAPVPTAINSLATVLSHHTAQPGVPAAIAALHRLVAAPPRPVYELTYSQTPASVLQMTKTTNSQLGQISLATVWIPVGLAAAGAVLVLLGAVLVWRRRTPPGRTAEAVGEPSEPRAA